MSNELFSIEATSHPESDESSSSSEDENYDEPVEEHKKVCC